MRKLISNTFVSLDGVMQAPGGPEEDPSSNFKHGGWSAGYWDEMMGEVMDAATSRPFDLLLGRKTYDIFSAFWPLAEGDPEQGSMAKKLNSATKYVASRSLKKADWKTSHILQDAAKDVAKLKEGDGPEIQVHGSANLLQTLTKHNLIDEYRVWTFPVVLGSGKRLFEEGVPAGGLEVSDSKTSSTGVVIATYKPAGAIKGGSFALADEATQREAEQRMKAAASR